MSSTSVAPLMPKVEEDKPRILVVEDDRDMLDYVRGLLDPRFAVETEEDGGAALERARAHPPDLVLADVVMPRLDGIGLLKELRRDERTKTIPVLLLSGRGEDDARVEGLTAGADDYLVKPFRPKDLLARVCSNLKLSQLRKEREEEIRQLNAALERKVEERTRELSSALREIESFAYSVAHDLRAPLRAMTGFSHALLEDYGARLGVEGREFARRILEAGRRMDALIRDLLDYSRLSREKIELRETGLAEAAEEVLLEMAPELRERGATVEVERPLARVRAHPLTLRRAMANLVSNAVKFVAAGVAPRVRLRAERAGGRTRLWVEDNGIGIAPEYHERIFGVFERLHAPGAYPGTGIGLAIVRKAMERMGGRAGVESEPGRGSRFYLEFPGALEEKDDGLTRVDPVDRG